MTTDQEKQSAISSTKKKKCERHNNAETYTICKADLLFKGEGDDVDNIKFGSTLSADAFPSLEFDFMLSNPPYGKSWKTDLERFLAVTRRT